MDRPGLDETPTLIGSGLVGSAGVNCCVCVCVCVCVCRSQLRSCCTQKRTVVRDALGKQVHLEDTAEALQQHLHQEQQ